MTVMPPPTRATPSLATPALGAVAGAAFVAYLAVAPGPASWVNAVSNLVQAVVPLCIAAPAAALAARRSRGRGRTSWTLLAAGAASWGLGQIVWAWFEVVRDEPVPYPGWADVGFVGSLPLLLAGVLIFPSATLRPLGRARAVVDGCIGVTATLFASYGTFLGVIYRAREGGFLARVLAVVYPSADLLILAVVLAVIAGRAHRLDGPLPWIGVGVGFLAVADVAFAYFTAVGEYSGDPVSDAGWPLGFGCIAIAAWSAVRAGATPEVDAPARARTMVGLALPFVPVLAAVGVFSVSALGNVRFGPFLGVTGSALGVLFVLRQIVTQLENRELTRHLEATVVALRHHEGELRFQAFHDPLTALANRALFRDRLEHALSPRRPDPVSVLFIDVDDFKVVNDTLGHDAGDRLLALVAERLRACVRASDTVARLGGDEFAILIEGERARSEGAQMADRILAALETPFAVGEVHLHVTVSVGVASGHYDSAEEVLKDADLAMYSAKDRGKGRAETYGPELRRAVVTRLALVGDEAAIDAPAAADPTDTVEPA